MEQLKPHEQRQDNLVTGVSAFLGIWFFIFFIMPFYLILFVLAGTVVLTTVQSIMELFT